GAPADEARILLLLGSAHLGAGDYAAALDYGQQSLAIATPIGDSAAEMAGHVLLGATYYAQGKLEPAYEQAQMALQRLEQLHGAITVPDLKTSYLDQVAEAYSLAVLVAIRLGRYEEAFFYAEQARARAFLDQLANGHVDFRVGAAAELLQREQTLREELAARRAQLIELKSQSGSDSEAQLALQQADAKAQELETAYDDLLDEMALQNPEVVSLVSAEVATAAETQDLLPPAATLVEYYVTRDVTLAFILTQDALNVVSLTVGREALRQAIQDSVADPDPYPAALQQLHEWLITPLTPLVTTPNLIIVPHNVLHYLPFAALTDGERYLNDSYTISLLPSASALRFLPTRGQATSGTALVLGSPVTTEPLPILESAGDEARQVAGLYGDQPLLGPAATESAVRAQGGQASILHLAAHGRYNRLNPLFNTIYLAGDNENDGRLEMHEVYGLDLTAATSLVVLSACETQVGELSNGDEVAGLNRAFLYAGTPSVIASLWNVNDQATATLMESFYTHLQEGLGKAEALRQAQLDTRVEYPHPYYWAAFALTGDGGGGPGIAGGGNQFPATTSPLMWGGALLVLGLLGWATIVWRKRVTSNFVSICLTANQCGQSLS
ncbi:MAG: CHAT domain-containing tetratricopeptide repeat protein, partial [Chloroflexota bacterium]